MSKRAPRQKRARHTVRWNAGVEEWAQAIVSARKYDNVQDLVTALVREEWERRHSNCSSSDKADAQKLIEDAEGRVPPRE